jgi:tetratricopeptide (TPR) repeat protein
MQIDGDGQRPAGTQVRATGPARTRAQGPVWPVRSGAVPPLADGFSARPETVPGLAAALAPGAVVALVGGRGAATRPRERLASCGKTQLAVFRAESLWRSREVDLLVWVAATSRASVLSGYVEAAAAMGTDPADVAESVAARLASWLGETARPWLVVLDDLRDAADLEGLWPRGPAGRVLITAQDEGIVSGEPRARILPVGAFSTREALGYLMGRLTADPDQRHGAIDLAAELRGEPPALAQASAVIASSGLSCHDYRDYFTQRQAQLIQHADGGRVAAAAVTWTVSAEQAERLSPGGAAQLLLALAALLGGHAIPGTVFTTSAACGYLGEGGAGAVVDPERAWDAVLSLERTGLLAIDPASTPPAVWMSPMVAAQVRAAMPEGMADRAVKAAADALLEVWPENEPQPWLAAGLRSCAASLQHAAGDRLWAAGGCHPLLPRAGRSLDGARLAGPAAGYWTQLAAASDRILGPDNPGTLMAGSYLAQALLAAGQAAEAVSWSQRVVAGRTRMLGPDHQATIAARVSLGHALVAAGQPGHAVTVLGEAAGDCERVRGPGHLDTLSARDGLAAACRDAGKHADATGLYRRTLADRERVQGPQHPDTMTARENLADACLADGQVKEAISCYKRTLADRERVLGPDHMDTIAARRNMASAYHSAGKMAAALQLYEQVCADHERVLGASHPGTLARRADLAHAYYAAGRLMDATTLLRDTVSRCEQALPPGDPLTQTLRKSMTNIAGG